VTDSISRRSSSASTAGREGRTLVARFHSLGDVILATGVACLLSERGERVEVATERRFHPLFEGLPLAAIWDPETIRSAGRFDRIIDLQANASSRRLLHGLGPVTRQRSRSLARRWLVAWGLRPPRPRIPHAVERYAEAARLGDASLGDLRPRVAVTEDDLAAGKRMRTAWETSGEFCVGLAGGASRRMKRWPEENYARLGRDLRARGIRTLRFVEPAETDGVDLQASESEPSGESGPAVSAPLRPLKALLGRCQAVVTNDSGVMHLAVALGVPVLALFGSTVLDLGFGPIGSRDRVLQRDLACRPCAVHGARFCWLGHERCLKEITPERVMESVLAIVGEEGRAWK
jgi:ADP-heptose:LPS heptosyltransferase